MQDLPSRKEIDKILEEDSKSKKIVIGIISIFLLILISSYFLLSYPIYPIIASNYESYEIEEKTILTDEFSIVFLEKTYEILKNNYLENEEVEITACLLGDKKNNYFIDEIYFPEVITQSVTHVIFKPCPDGTLIWLHSHPYKRCIASKQDIDTLNKQNNNNETLMMIMCSTTQFNIYG